MLIKYSILLPTKNGGRYLTHCINAVLEQDYENIELIISDNENSDETPNIIKNYHADSRVISLRLENQVSVTDNWNNALNAATGDYILMLGDDDLLLPECISNINNIITKQNKPDCLTYNAFGYISPGAIGNNADSYYSKSFFIYPDNYIHPRILPKEERIKIVKNMYKFKVGMPLNIQTTIMSANVIKKIHEGIFQPPFPDHYALNALLLKAEEWYFTPEKYLIIGISPKSFGHYVYSNKQEQGKEYLGLNKHDKSLLPGNELINNMCVWLGTIKENYPDYFNSTEINREAYLARQIYWWIKELNTGSIDKATILKRFKMIKAREYFKLIRFVFNDRTWKKLKSIMTSKKDGHIDANFEDMIKLEGINDIHEFSTWLQK